MRPIKKTAVRDFGDDFYTRLTESIDLELAKQNKSHPGTRAVAAFDADGTLWNTDVGEAFFEFQIKNCPLKTLPPNPWGYYEGLKAKGQAPLAYLWLAQINAGHPLEQVRDWARQAFLTNPDFPFFESQRRLINHLQKQSVEVFVVSASVQWAVEPAAAVLGIDSNHVLGVKTQVVNGVVTDQQEGHITYRDGKVDALMTATGGRSPVFCCGNTNGDLALLESAEPLRLVVASQPPGSALFPSEDALMKIARERQWWTHEFWTL